MASIDTYLGFQWGVDKLTITSGDGSVQPRLLSVVASDPNTLRATFDIDMMFLEDPGSVLKPYHWSITEQISGDVLPILYITRYSSTEIDIHTANQSGVDYDVLVDGVKSARDQLIDPAFDDATFSGIADTYPTFSTMRGFFGHDAGLQGERVDVSAPYLNNQDPAPLETGVALNKSIEFDLVDNEGNIDLTTVEIWVDGDKVYDGATDTFLSGVGFDYTASTRTVLPGPPAGHHFTLDPAADWTEFDTISVRVYAEDFAAFTLDTTWTFRAADETGPTIDSNTPTGTGVDKNANITFSAHDPSSGVDSGTLNVTIGGTDAIVAGTFVNSYTGSITPDGSGGIDVVVDPPTVHPSFTSVSVAVSVYDNESNQGTLNWSFTVEDHLGCLVTPIDPTNGQTDFPITGTITLSIEDEDDVLENTIVVEIDPGTGYETAFVYADATQFKPGWDGPSSDVSEVGGVYTIVIDPTADFNVGSTVLVRVTAEDPSGNPERLS